MPLDEAERVRADYAYNNPRIVRAEKALAALALQRGIAPEVVDWPDPTPLPRAEDALDEPSPF
ncbi:hypothetical protein [uncultured Jannaschia sp.]|uniref:hypothetical protein n=1 Tax=uncultured Jannaschia sp. TaxID=293347 RepID=UPI0026352ACD|nr:hypothetical protein [uncultured Jannaschia sp.]